MASAKFDVLCADVWDLVLLNEVLQRGKGEGRCGNVQREGNPGRVPF